MASTLAADPQPGPEPLPVGMAATTRVLSCRVFLNFRLPGRPHCDTSPMQLGTFGPKCSHAPSRPCMVHYNDDLAWKEFLMLPACVLCAPPRGGRRHRRATAAYTIDRLNRWLEGERASLWDSRPSPPPLGQHEMSDGGRRDFATALAREGLDKKACAALLSSGLAPETAETVQELKALHPIQPPPAAVQLSDLPPPPEIAVETVARALKSFPAGSAPGPSGLRPQHLLEACPPGSEHGFLDQLTAVVNLLARGGACRTAAPFVAGAKLVAIPKPQGGIRPIAIGESLRRLVGKCLMSMVQQDARSYFWPAQVGVAVPAGAECVLHTVRAWLHRHKHSTDKVLCKLDFQNAFNVLSRDKFLAECPAHFPALARWTTWCYQDTSSLRFGTSTLDPASGVQQGDPLGPLLFAAALQPLAEELRHGPLDFATFYLDDGVLAGSAASVAAALSHVQMRAQDLGLTLNLAKCEVIAAGQTPDAPLAALFPSKLLLNADGSPRILRNFELLGAALGDADHVTAATTKRVAKATALLDAIGRLEDPQVALRLLRSCGGHARLMHSMRCVPPSAQQSALLQFDVQARHCLASFTGMHLNHVQWAQAARGFDHGGLALRSAVLDAPAAYLASIGGCLDRCSDLDPAFDHTAATNAPDVTQALLLFNPHVDKHLQLGEVLRQRQKSLTQLLDSHSWHRQLAASTPAAKAMLLSESQPGARAFLAAVPGGAAWSQLLSSPRCASAWACLMPWRTHGVPAVMGS